MTSNKSTVESLFHNLARIICATILFIIFGIITYRIPMNLNFTNGLSIFAVQFYASILQLIIIFLIFKYGFKKKNKRIEEDKREIKTNLFDVLTLLFIGLLLKNILYEGLFYLENIINITPKHNSDVIQGLIQRMKITNLDKIYRFSTGIILAPTVEELFFRKGVFAYFGDKNIRPRNLILISGLSFGLTHAMGLAIAIHAMITGIIFAVIYMTTKNVIYPIMGHGLNNLMSFIITIFRDNNGIEDVETYIEAGRIIEIRGAIIISLILLVIISIMSYIKRKVIISSDFKDKVKGVFVE